MMTRLRSKTSWLVACAVLMGTGTAVLVPFLSVNAVSNDVFENPLPSADVTEILTKIIQFLLGLVGLLALLALIWGGISMIIGFGSEDKVAHAKKIIFWAIAGLVVAGLSYVIVEVIARDLLEVS